MYANNRGLSRRTFFKGAAMISLCAAGIGEGDTASASGAAIRLATTSPTPVTMPPHGGDQRGMELAVHDPSAEGRFGRIFKTLPAHSSEDDQLKDLLTGLGLLMKESVSADNDNPSIPAGFTFLGQFIDHDITLDTTSLTDALADPDAVTNFRTPRYDLDSLYGRGPSTDPQFYNPNDRAKLRIERNIYGVDDLPRTNAPGALDDGKALIPDGRNDENMVIAQLHLVFIKFHNKLVDRMRAQRVPAASVFESARRMARWHYQWIVIHDYLPRVVGQTMKDLVYKDRSGQAPLITMKFFRPTNKDNRAFIPLEFAAAAFRFGHTMVRPAYSPKAAGPFIPLFEPNGNDLRGKRPIPAAGVIEWKVLFDLDPSPAGTDPAVALPRRSRQIDCKLSEALFNLPLSILPESGQSPEQILSVRNLLRARKLRLPSGQQVAKAMGTTPLTYERLGLNENIWPKTLDVPLWYYILKEAEVEAGSRHLGPVGGRIVAEVLVGLLQRDRNSYLYLSPKWKPNLPSMKTGDFTMVDLLRFVGITS